jgi:hypothetical protein
MTAMMMMIMEIEARSGFARTPVLLEGCDFYANVVQIIWSRCLGTDPYECD